MQFSTTSYIRSVCIGFVLVASRRGRKQAPHGSGAVSATRRPRIVHCEYPHPPWRTGSTLGPVTENLKRSRRTIRYRFYNVLSMLLDPTWPRFSISVLYRVQLYNSTNRTDKSSVGNTPNVVSLFQDLTPFLDVEWSKIPLIGLPPISNPMPLCLSGRHLYTVMVVVAYNKKSFKDYDANIL